MSYVVEVDLGECQWKRVSRPTESLEEAIEWCDYKNRVPGWEHRVAELTEGSVPGITGVRLRVVYP